VLGGEEPDIADRYEVVMMSRWVEDGNKERLGEFERVGDLSHLWWFPNYAYNKLGILDVLSGAFSPDGWRAALDYFVDREFESAMQQAHGVVYVRNDLAEIVSHDLFKRGNVRVVASPRCQLLGLSRCLERSGKRERRQHEVSFLGGVGLSGVGESPNRIGQLADLDGIGRIGGLSTDRVGQRDERVASGRARSRLR